jgi:hypothetical protein
VTDPTATGLSRRLRHRAERLDLPTDHPIHQAADEFDCVTAAYFNQPPAATVGDFLAARERARSFLNR